MIYSKLFEYLTNTQVWQKPLHVRIVWLTMNALTNKMNCVNATLSSLSEVSMVSESECYDAIQKLKDDHYIVENSSGWLVLEKGTTIPDLAKECERRDYQKNKMTEYRDKGTAKPSAKSKSVRKPKTTTENTWKSYSNAYHRRYSVRPVRNATTNSQMKKFVDRIGIDEAPQVAEFYVFSNNSFYVQKGHSVGVLLADAEKLRTECLTNRRVSSTQAKITDRQMSTHNAFQKLLDEIGE